MDCRGEAIMFNRLGHHPVFVPILPEAPIVLDAGAGADGGSYLNLLFGLRPASRVLCLEPNPEQIAGLARLSSQSGGQIIVWQAYLTGCSDRIMKQLKVWDAHEAGSTLIDREDDRGKPDRTFLAWPLTMPTILAVMPRIDVLKLDIEGSEDEFLLDTPENCFDSIGQISIEWHVGVERDKPIARMESLGYKYQFAPTMVGTFYKESWLVDNGKSKGER